MLGQISRDHPKPRVSGPALDALMARHDGLVHAVLRRQWGGPLDYEARLQAGRIGLWHALQGYDPKRGTAFSSYAWPAIQREIWRAVRQSKPSDLPPSVDLPADFQAAMTTKAGRSVPSATDCTQTASMRGASAASGVAASVAKRPQARTTRPAKPQIAPIGLAPRIASA